MALELIHKLAHGRSDISPVLRDLGKFYGLTTFVETGSQVGHTIEDMVGYFNRIYSIEISKDCYDICVNKFKDYPEVNLVHGSSGKLLGALLKEALITKALFWLDAHGPPADEGNQVPAELEAIEKYAPFSIVVIDDVTWENGKHLIDGMHTFVLPEFWYGLHIKNMNLGVLIPRQLLSLVNNRSAFPAALASYTEFPRMR